MATLTVYGDSADNWVKSRSSSYATARAGTGTKSTGTVSGFHGNAEWTLSVGNYDINELFFKYDTSSLGASAVISDAAYYFYCPSKNIDDAGDFPFIHLRQYNWGASVDTGDFRPTNGTSSGDTFLGLQSYNSISESAYFNLSNVNGPDSINKTGTTYVYQVTDESETTNAPTGSNYLNIRMADYTGTSQDPYVFITYTIPIEGQTSLDASASLSSAGGLTFAGAAALGETATLAAAAGVTSSAAVAFSGAVSVAALAGVTLAGVAAADASAALAPVGTLIEGDILAEAAFSAAVTLSAASAVSRPAAAVLSTSAALGAAPSLTTIGPAEASLSASAVVAVLSSVTHPAAAVLAAAVSLAAAGEAITTVGALSAHAGFASGSQSPPAGVGRGTPLPPPPASMARGSIQPPRGSSAGPARPGQGSARGTRRPPPGG